MPAPGVRYGPVFSEAMEIPFNQPHQHGPELDYIRDAIQRAHLCGDGYYTKKCHELLAERTGAGKVLLVHSGTAALEMAALLIDCRPGDEIIMPSYTFVSTANAFVLRGGVPVFVDIRPDTQNIDGTSGTDDEAFFRTSDRSKPHNAYASGAGLLKVIEKKGYSLNYRGLTDENHFRFATKAEPNTLDQYGSKAKDATYIDMSGCYPLTRCYFEFNEDDGLYYRSQHLSGSSDGPHIDAVTGKQLSFKNILVQNTFYEELGEGYLAFQCHDTTRDGWFFTNGRGIHVNWEKTSDYGATKYYDDNGDEIVLNTGKTMICIVENGDSFTFH